jgi:spore germination protein YaaH
MSDTSLHEDTQPLPAIDVDIPVPRLAERSSRSAGCWIPVLLTGFVAGVLVIVGLFLPPVNLWNRLFGTQYTMLSASANAVAQDGLTLVVDPASVGTDFGVQIGSTSVDDFMGGSDAARMAVPPNLALQSAIYAISTTGSQPETLNLDIDVPQSASADLLSLYGFNAQSGEWRFIPSTSSTGTVTTTVEDIPQQVALFQVAPPQQPTVLVAVDVTQTLVPEVGQLATIVSPAGLQPDLEGKLKGSLAAGVDNNAGYLVMPVIRNYTDPRALDPQTVSTILSSRSLRSEHAAQIVNFASSNGVDGVLLDYRGLAADQRENFAAFVRELGTGMDNLGLSLGVVVPAAENIAGAWDTGAYDWRALGQSVDLLQVNLALNPTHFTPGSDQVVEAMLRWAIHEVDRSKLLIGLSALSVREVSSTYTSVGYDEALSGLGNVQVSAAQTEAGTILPGTEILASLDGFGSQAGMQTDIQTPYIEYRDEQDSTVSKIWLTTGDALRFRMDRTLPFALGGVAFEDLLANGLAGDAMTAIMNYKLQLPAAPVDRELALRWRIEGASGVVAETTTGLNDDLLVTIAAPDGNYAVNVAVVSGSAEVARSGAAVAMFAPTLTPTPLPTSTPTPTPTATPRPVVAAPVVSAPSGGGGGAAVAPGSGSIVGGFEYGGHVTNPASDRAAGAMRSAGMTWMKIQHRYSPGMDPGSVAGNIADARARGFKILIGIVGYPNDLANGGEGYIQGFAQFAGGVAALGPEAIEIWNEPNIDREWPRDQISGAGYTNLLRQSYAAIKGANGGVMVISGAPAPTGAEAAFPGQVVNDDNWIRDMVNAGGLQYMDCLGAHYNEGIIGPSQRSGDPRDGYYTRYFYGMLDTYWGLIGGQKPICFTELGFLTSEGYPPLPSYFGWASNVTLAQHAAWLAESAALASQSGRVRLMIVWNVDFSRYDSDPMAGYAMIRADGSCPACSAMAGAR